MCWTRLEPCCSSLYGPVTVSVSCVSCAMWCWCVVLHVLMVVIVRCCCCFPFRTCRLVVNRHLVKETKKYKKKIPFKTHPRLEPLPSTSSLPSTSLPAAAGVSWRDVVVEWGVWGSSLNPPSLSPFWALTMAGCTCIVLEGPVGKDRKGPRTEPGPRPVLLRPRSRFYRFSDGPVLGPAAQGIFKDRFKTGSNRSYYLMY
jgi:hypothetical protein